MSSAGVRPLPSKVDAIEKFPTPSTIKELQKFVGMVNYYHRFLPGIANIMTLLYEALAGKPRNLVWSPEHQRAFDDTKKTLASAATLSFPVPESPITLTTDASNVAVGAVIEQLVDGQPRPLGFFSRKLRQPEIKYSTFDP